MDGIFQRLLGASILRSTPARHPRPFRPGVWGGYTSAFRFQGVSSVYRTLSVLFLMLCAYPLAAQHNPYGVREDEPNADEPAPWKEGGTDLPAYPKEDDLVHFPVYGGSQGFDYYLDKASLSVGKDRLVRYTAVVKSRTGARNVLFEAINCRDGAYKTYAYGTQAGGFRALSNPAWRPLTESGGMAYRDELARQYLCSGYGTPRKMEEIIKRLGMADRLKFEEDRSHFY